jgi:hypothetical protein
MSTARIRELFTGRKLVVATMHGKEAVIGPPLQQALGVVPVLTQGFDSDFFGTFSGEIARRGSQLEAARSKALRALELSGETLAVASEGAFGAHPTAAFLQADYELVLLVDRLHGIELEGWEASTRSTAVTEPVEREADLFRIAERAGFPEHGVILKVTDGERVRWAAKGIHERDRLIEAYREAVAQSGSSVPVLETDLRAMHNPTRMEVIAAATGKLVEKLLSACPHCQWPGYEVVEVVRGLRCKLCGLPTRGVRAAEYGCRRCGHRSTKEYPDGRQVMEAMYCDHCNP